jgi:methylisocitrate lyase
MEGGKTPLVPVKEAEAMGFKMIVPALSALFAAARGMYEVMSEIRKEGVSEGYSDRLFTFREFAELVRLDEIREMEEKYIPPSALEEKYRGKKRIVE